MLLDGINIKTSIATLRAPGGIDVINVDYSMVFILPGKTKFVAAIQNKVRRRADIESAERVPSVSSYRFSKGEKDRTSR
jgi:hypothetical protein